MTAIKRLALWILPIYCAFFVTSVNAQVSTIADLPATLRSDLIAFYPFSGNANDISCNSNNGTVSGALLASDRFGVVNTAYSFNGSSSRINVNDNVALRLNNTDFSISLWVYINSYNSSAVGATAFIYKRGSGFQDGWCVGADAGQSNRSFLMVSGGPDPRGYTPSAISTGSWQHLVIVYSKTAQTATFHLNGVMVGQTSGVDNSGTPVSGIPSPSAVTTALMSFGVDTHIPRYWLNGRLDDIGIWNKALLQCEIDWLYNDRPGGVKNNCFPALTFTPRFGPVGSAVTISGSGFSATPSANVVYFGSTRATVNSATATSLNVTVPLGSVNRPVTVLNTNSRLQFASSQSYIPTFCGSINFSNRVDITAPTQPRSLAAGDLDGDGKTDFVALSSPGQQFTVYKNNATAGLLSGASFAASSYTYIPTAGRSHNDLRLADLNNDGKLDIVISSSTGLSTNGNLYIIPNTSTGAGNISFGTMSTYATGYDPHYIDFGDIDGDGLLDVVIANNMQENVFVYKNSTCLNAASPTITLAAPFSFNYTCGSGVSVQGIAVRDLNSDGKPEIVAAGRGCSSIQVTPNTSVLGEISFGTSFTMSTPSEPSMVMLADLNRDGKNEIVIACETGLAATSTIRVFRNDYVSGTFAASSFTGFDLTVGSGTRQLEIADLDGDGYLDIIAASRNNNRVDVLKNNFRTGSMTSTSFSGVVSFAGPTSSAPYSVIATDLNQDSKPELVTANENSNNVSVFNNVGIGSPTDAGTISAFRQLCTLTSLQPSMQNGVVAFYSMCGNLSSASGGSALSGSNTTLTQGPYGYSNTAYSFNGSNSEMTIPYQSWYANLTDNFSFSFWVKNNLAPGHAGAHILWRGNGNLSVGFDSDNKINFARQGQAGLAASLTAISSNWTHVVIVKAGSSNKIYINGVLDVDVNNATGLINSVNDPMIIGRAGLGGNGGSYWFNGSLSQLMFYNKVLNLAEVNDLYQDEWTNLCVGSTGTLTSTVSGGSWSSSNTGIATINSTTGVVTPITPGSTTITYTMAGSGGCATLTTTRPITISSPTAGTLSGDQFICLTNWTSELTTTKPMTQGWSQVLPSTNTSKQYRMVVNGRWGIANSTAHRDPAYDGINGTPVPNRGCDANWSLNGSCPPPVPNLPSGYSPTNTYTYMLGAGTAAGTTIAFSDGAYGDNVGTLTYQLFSTTANTTTFSSSVTGGVWSSSNNGVAIIHPTTGVVTAVAAGTATMTYTVAATAGCITATATRTVTVSTEVSAGTLTGTQSLCVGSTSTFTSTATGGTWSSSNSAVATINSTTGLITALTPGTATMTYTVAGTGGCATATATRAVTVTANPTISALSDTTRVCGTSTVLNAGAGYSSYSWNTGAATQTITVTTGSFYKVTVTNAAGCAASDSTFLSLVNANIINNDTTICLGASVRLSIDSIFSSRTVCESTQLPTNLRANLVGYWPFCGNPNDRSGNANNGISSGATLAPDRFGIANTSYSFSNSYIRTTNPGPLGNSARSISFWAKPATNYNGSGFIISYGSNNSGGAEYGIRLDNSCGNAALLDANLSTTASAGNQNYPNGTWLHYVVTYNPASGPYVTNAKFYVNGQLVTNPCGQTNPSLHQINTLAEEPITFGRWGDLNNTQNGGYPFVGEIDDIFMWSRELSINEVAQLYTTRPNVQWSTSATSNSITVSPTQTTMYYVTVSDGVTTCTDSVRITVTPPPTAGTLSGTQSICVGSTSNFTSTAAAGIWSSLNSSIASVNSSTGVVTGIAPGTTTITYTVAGTGGCLTATATRSVTVNARPAFNPLSDTTRICGTSTVLNAGAGYSSYSWSNGASTQSITVTTSGPVNITSTTSTGCTVTDSTFLSLINARIINNDTSLCLGSSIRLSVDSLFAARTACTAGGLSTNLRNGLIGYWPFCGNANDMSANGNNGTFYGGTSITGDRFNNIQSSAYYNGQALSYVSCGTANNLDIGNNKTLTVAAWINTYSLIGTRIIVSKVGRVTSNLFGAFTLWLDHGTPTFTVTNQNGSPVWYRHAAATSQVNPYTWYHLIGELDPVNGQIRIYVNGVLAGTDTWAGTMDTSPTGELLFGSHFKSDFGLNYMYNFHGDIDDIHMWNRKLTSQEMQQLINAPRPIVSWNPGGATSNSITVTPGTTTMYYATVTDGIGSCTDSVRVTVTPPPTAGTLSGTQSLCVGSTSTFTSTATGGTWSSSNSAVATINFTTGLITALTPGTATMTYSVGGTGGCATATATRAVTVTANPTISALSDTTRVCGTSTVLNAGSGFSTYSWSIGSTAQSITATTNGFYSVTVTNAQGCTASDSTILSLLNVSIINNNSIICGSQPVQLQLSLSDSASFRVFYDGRVIASAPDIFPSSPLSDGTVNSPLQIGGWAGPGWNGPGGRQVEYFKGHIDNVRISKIARYNGFYSPPRSLIVDNNTTLAYNFEEASGVTVLDQSSGVNNGTISGNVQRVAITPFGVGKSAYFDGDFDYVTVSNPLSFPFNGLNDFTFECWVKNENDDKGNIITNRSLSVNTSPFTSLTLGGPVGGSVDGISGYARYSTDLSFNPIYSSQTLDNSWHHIALVRTTRPLSVIWSTGATTNSINVTPISTSTYTVTVSNGISTCVANTVVTVTPPATAGTLSGTQSLCVGSTSTFTSTATGGTWSSSNSSVATINATTGLVTALTAGTATMTYTVPGTGGCLTATATRSVTITAAPTAGTLSGTQSLCVGSTSTFTSTATGGTWSSSNSAVATINSTTGLVTALTPGTATMTYSVAGTGGCATATATRAVTVTANPTISALSDTTRVCGTSTVLNAGAGYTSYSWSNGATAQTITVTSGGFYKVTVANAAGCSASDSTFLSLVNANIVNNDTAICLGASVRLSIDSVFSGRSVCESAQLPTNLRNGLVGYWPFCGNLDDKSGNGNTATNNGATSSTDRMGNTNAAYLFNGSSSYMVVPASSSLSVSQSITISFWAYPTSTNAGIIIDRDICQPNPDWSINWTGTKFGLRYGVTGADYTMESTTALPINRWYHVMVVRDITSARISMYINGVLNNSISFPSSAFTNTTLPIHIGAAVCNRSSNPYFSGRLDDIMIWSRALSAAEAQQTGNSYNTVSWSPGGATTNSILVSPSTTTMYYATVTDGIGTCLDSVRVTTTPPPTAGTLSGTQSLCVGSTSTFTSTATGGTWSSSNTSVATINSTTGLVTALAPGTATMTYTVPGSGGCLTATATRSVTVTATPSAGTLSGTQSLCVGSSSTFTSTATGGTWSSSNTSVATINSTTGLVTALAPGTATMTYTIPGSGGCSTATASRAVTVSALPTAGTLSGDQFICLSDWTSELTTTKPMTQGWSQVLPSTNTSKQYRMVVNGRWGIANSTAHRDPAYDGINGTPVPNRGCDANWSLNGSCPPPVPNLPSGYSPTNTYTYMLGAGTAAGTTIVFSDGAYGDNVGTLTYQLFSTTANTTTFSSSVTGGVWSSSNNGVAIIHPTTGVITAVAAGTATMTYTVPGTGGCLTATATRSVTITAAPTAGTLTGTQSLCVGSTSTFTSTATGGTWSSSNSAVATINSTTGLITALTPGTATMTYTVAGTGGCATATATRAVTVTANPTISALSDTTRVCGTSTVLNAGAGYNSYSWSTGATTQTITATNSDSYLVTVFNTAGCSATDSTFLSLVNANITNNDTSICLGASIRLNIDSLFPGRTACTTGGIFPATLRNGLMGYWSFCGNANDRSGNGNHGTLFGGSSISNDRFNNGQSAAAFDGLPLTYISCGAANNLDIGNNRPMTIAAWIYPTNFGSGNVIVSKVGRVTTNVYGAFTLVLDSGLPKFVVSNQNANPVWYQTATSYTYLTTNTWYHIMGELDPLNGQIKIYVNGTLVGSNSWGGTMDTSPTGELLIGSHFKRNFASEYMSNFSGRIDDVYMWNRTLTSQEIQQLATSYRPSISWSPGGATGNSITVSPTQTTTYYVSVSDGVNTCTDSVRVTVTPPPIAGTLSGTQALCIGSTSTFTSTASGGTWSSSNATVATVNATTGLVTALTAGTATITYSVAGTGGCATATATRSVTVTAPPNAGTISGTQALCIGSTSNFTSTATGGTWHSSNTSVATINSSTGLVTALSAGTAIMTYSVAGTGGCLTATATRSVTVTAPPAAGTLSGTQALCVSSTTNFTSTTTGGIWSSSNTSVATINSATGLVTALTPGTAVMTYSVAGTGGCATATATLSVTVTAPPNAGTISGTQSLCIGGTTTLLSTASGGFWSSSDATIASIDPVTGLIITLSPGTVTISYTVAGTGGCATATATSSFTVHPKPSVSFSINNAAQCVNINSFVFTNNSTISAGTMTHTWNFGNNVSLSAVSPTYTYPTAGAYTVTLVSTSAEGCSDSTNRSVIVHSLPTGTLQPPASALLCEGGSLVLTANGGSTYQWFLNNAAIAGATNSTHLVTLPGIYTVNLISGNGCIAAANGSVTIQLVVKPTANFSYTNYCASFPTQFNNQSNTANSSLVNYNWVFGAGLGTSQQESPAFTFPGAGTYNVSLTVTPVACPSLASSISKPVTVIAPPTNQRYQSLNAVENRDLQLNARTYSGATYVWSPSRGLSNERVANPIYNYNQETEYVITITTGVGCIIKDTQLVRIFKAKEIYVPKAFSPNKDGSNDNLSPKLVGVRTLTYFKIYNRWGQLLYQTSNANEGWDGTYRGAKQPMESYVWIAEGIDIDNQIIKRTGTFLLIR